MNMNYTNICLYCGEIYESNKSTSKYCCPQHNSLYNANGSNIDYAILDNHGVYVNYHEILSDLHEEGMYLKARNTDDLSRSFLHNHNYNGPFPKGKELLLVSGYIIRKLDTPQSALVHFAIKPMEALTKEEKASSRIIRPDISYFNQVVNLVTTF